MKALRSFTAILARFFLSAIFLTSGMNIVFHWQEQERNLLNILSEWQCYATFSEGLQDFFGMIVPWTSLLLVVATLFQFIGGLLVLLGIRERLGAVLLILFLIPTTVIMHQFWFVDGPAKELQSIHFLKNLAILGGLFLILLHGGRSDGGGKSFPPINLG